MIPESIARSFGTISATEGRSVTDMSTLVTKAGPGDTQLIVCPNRWATSKPQGEEPAAVARCENSAYELRRAVECAQRAQITGSHHQPGVLEVARTRRQDFWADTCREIMAMRFASPAVLDLHRQHGCRFVAPSLAQVQQILDALDAAMPFWDRDHPELFYKTLELNFPDLVRGWRHQFRR